MCVYLVVLLLAEMRVETNQRIVGTAHLKRVCESPVSVCCLKSSELQGDLSPFPQGYRYVKVFGGETEETGCFIDLPK